MNIYSNEGKNYFQLKVLILIMIKKKIYLIFKRNNNKFIQNNKSEYIINSDKSKLSNNNKLIELNGNVVIKSLIKEEDKLYSNSFIWNIENSEFLLVGNVKFKNNSINLNSKKQF